MTDDWVRERIARKDEKLHRDLAEYFEEASHTGWPVLRHPLVYQVPFFDASSANDAYAYKREALAKAEAASDFSTYVWLHERPYRLEALLRIRERMTPPQFWVAAREVWIDSENVWQHLDEWLELFATRVQDLDDVMTEEELEAFAALPDPVPVYRGCAYELNEDGLSWTTDHARALWFAKRFAQSGVREGCAPLVIHATVPKADVVGYFQSRNEDEIVVRDLTCVTVSEYEDDLG